MATAGIDQLAGAFFIDAIPYGEEHIVIFFARKFEVRIRSPECSWEYSRLVCINATPPRIHFRQPVYVDLLTNHRGDDLDISFVGRF